MWPSPWIPGCSTTPVAPSCSTSTATCSDGPRVTTRARPATRSSSTPARSRQFVYLLPGDPYLRAPAMDHFGLHCESLGQLHAIVEAAKARQVNDERVTVIDVHERVTHGPTHDYTMTSVYIGFVMPLLIELQHLERHERVEATDESGRTLRARGADRHSRRPGRRQCDGVDAAARDGRDGQPHDHNGVSTEQDPRDRTRGRADAHRRAQ